MLCGMKIELYVNIELFDDVKVVVEVGVVGVGLFCFEFLFMYQKEMLEEEEQFVVYKWVVEWMKGMLVMICMIDVGVDKLFEVFDEGYEMVLNLVFGLCVICWSLFELQMFFMQLCVILCVFVFGQVKILILMFVYVQEIDQMFDLICEVKCQFDDVGFVYDLNVCFGVMIEILVVVIVLLLFLKCFDFLLIGMNDLIQYMFVIDCVDNVVVYLYDLLYLVVLYLIVYMLCEVKCVGVLVLVCGEMVGDLVFMCLLFGMGFIEFLMYLSQLFVVKQEILCVYLKVFEKLMVDVLVVFELEEVQVVLQWLLVVELWVDVVVQVFLLLLIVVKCYVCVFSVCLLCVSVDFCIWGSWFGV